MPIRILIRQAYGQVQDFQLVGGPGWINSDRFDIEAKVDDPAAGFGPQFVPTVLRQLLEERFKLKAHKETRELPVFALMLARSDGRLGPSLTPASAECAALMSAPRGRGPDGRGGPPPDGRGGPPADRRVPGRVAGSGSSPFDEPIGCGQRRGGFGRL